MKRKKLFFQKKAQAGTTLSWFVAVFVILFILVLYFIFAGLLAAERYVPLIGKGGNKISIAKTNEDFKAQKKLFYLLNFPLEEGETIKELIILSELHQDKEAEKKFKENSEIILKSSEEGQKECDLLLINDELIYNNLFKGIIIEGKIPAMYKTDFGYAEIFLFSNQQQINARLYSGKC